MANILALQHFCIHMWLIFPISHLRAAIPYISFDIFAQSQKYQDPVLQKYADRQSRFKG